MGIFGTEGMKTLTIELPIAQSVAREQEYYDLAGLGIGDGPRPYHTAKREIQRAIALLNRELRAIRQLESHTHDWNGNDYCNVCGADGRA